MKTTRWVMSMFAVGLTALMPALAGAEVLDLTPVSSRVLPADGSGVTKVALKFDLSGMREGQGRRVFDAFLNWELSGVPTEETSEFVAYAATTTWASTGEAPTVSEDPAGSWEISPASYARLGGLVRVNLERLVDAWAAGSTTNYGVVLAMPNLSAESLASQLANARLKFRYSFLTW